MIDRKKISALAEALRDLTYAEMMEVAAWFANAHHEAGDVHGFSDTLITSSSRIRPEPWASLMCRFAGDTLSKRDQYAQDPGSGEF